MVNLNKFRSSITKGKKNLRYGQCGVCEKHVRHPNEKKNCKCDVPKDIWSVYEWNLYCTKNNLNSLTGKKVK